MLVSNKTDREELVRRINALDLKKKFIAEIKVWRKVRTVPQNRLYWMWLRCITKEGESGYTEEELHEYFKKRYLNWREKEMFGDRLSITKSTTELTTKEFTEYLDKIQMQMGGEGISLPQPGEPMFDEFYARYGN
jgi:hypothetical protein